MISKDAIKDYIVEYIRENAEQLVTAEIVQQAMLMLADNYLHKEEAGIEGGYVPVNDVGKIDSQYLPSYVDDVLEYDSIGDFPAEGEEGKIYVAEDTSTSYRWSGSTYIALGINNASDLPVDTSNFGTILSSTEDTVQKALDKIDNNVALDTLYNVTSSSIALKLRVLGGINKDITFVDNNSNNHSITIENGLITLWEVE